MAVLRGFPILTSTDLPRLVAFYVAAFDAEQTYAFPADDGGDAYVSLAVGGATVGIGRSETPASGEERTALWFYVDDVDRAYAQALAAGATSVSPPADMPWGERVAQVRDPDQTVLNLGAEPG